MAATIDDVTEAMKDVVDPELGINVVDLGLIYDVMVDDNNIAVLNMTLTSAACPLQDVIEDQMTVYDKLALTKPWSVTFQFTRVTEPADLRIRMYSCNENNNVVQDEKGNSHHVLPGEPGYKDPEKMTAAPGTAR